MKLQETDIPGLMVAESDLRSDQRGAFSRFFCTRELEACFGERRVEQINYSLTGAVGTIRGMHYQHPPHAELKCVRCIRGRVWDVAVDIRRDSGSFLSWHAQELSATNRRMMIIPEGFAHGFQVLEENSELLYLHTAYYQPDAEGGLDPLDSLLDIEWPLEISEISERDRSHPRLGTDFTGVAL